MKKISIIGPESSGKTTLALQVIAETQKQGGSAAFIDAEHALDPKYAENLGVNIDDLFLGDKNAIMIAVRILAYGPEYSVELTNPNTEERFEHTFDLSAIDYKSLPEVDYSKNEFELELPASKDKITFKILNGLDEKRIDDELKSMQKIGVGTTREVTTRLKYLITSVNDSNDQQVINAYAQNMLSRDSLALRQRVTEITPDIELKQEVEIEGEAVTVDIPMTADFFWPTSRAS